MTSPQTTIAAPRRRPLRAAGDLVRSGPVAPGRSLPLAYTPVEPDVNLLSWAGEHRDVLRTQLHQYGALLFRGFPDVTRETFAEFVKVVSDQALPYLERSSPRSAVGNDIYTSTEQPPDQEIYLHNEHSYSLDWPMRLFFFCETQPAAGGATPLADGRRVYGRISERTRALFEERAYSYVRRMRAGLGLPWPEVFQTDDPAEVERYCAEHDIDVEWSPDGSLRTSQTRPVTRVHPVTGERVWFNHMLFFNVATLDDEVRAALAAADPDELPNNTYHGDGGPIGSAVLAEVKAAYDAERVAFAWQTGDILMIDNMLTMHARESFTPPRRILVAMSEPYRAAAPAEEL